CLATLGDEGTIQIWDAGSGRKLRAINASRPIHPRLATTVGLDWCPDGKRLASATGDGFVRIWDPESGQETASLVQKAQHLAWSPDGTRIALALAEESGLEVRRWDAGGERLGDPLLKEPGLVHSLAWSPDGRRLAAIFTGHKLWGIGVWNTENGERLFRS